MQIGRDGRIQLSKADTALLAQVANLAAEVREKVEYETDDTPWGRLEAAARETLQHGEIPTKLEHDPISPSELPELDEAEWTVLRAAADAYESAGAFGAEACVLTKELVAAAGGWEDGFRALDRVRDKGWIRPDREGLRITREGYDLFMDLMTRRAGD